LAPIGLVVLSAVPGKVTFTFSPITVAEGWAMSMAEKRRQVTESRYFFMVLFLLKLQNFFETRMGE
jgi:hypothetical protein